jgi:hypothetical protein
MNVEKKEERKMTTVQFKIPILLDLIFVSPLLLYRLIKFGRIYRKIHLGDGQFTIVDLDVYYRLGHLKWYLNSNGTKFYAARNIKIGPGKTKIIRLHREIMNPPRGVLVDHRNNDGLNNLMSNLRFATHSQNIQNRGKRKNTSSQYKGVRHKQDHHRQNPFQGVITVDGKRISLGHFHTEIEAAHAYDAAARKYHGEFAKLNFPEKFGSETTLRAR